MSSTREDTTVERPTWHSSGGPPLLRLDDAVEHFVDPGLHLHFSSTPSRSNAAIREVARRFAGRAPGFTLSSTGFHSQAHLLGILRLGARYIGCFFGDNHPLPRPNPLYTRLAAEGAILEQWSLRSLVEALRAGAMGLGWGVAPTLRGTTIAAELGARVMEAGDLTLVAALRPDVTFVHAAAVTPSGRVLVSPPCGEGFHAALGARRGVIVTVERLVDESYAAAHPDAMPLPPERILAVCVEPFGAHPQASWAAPHFGLDGYRDDLSAHETWRALAASDTVPRALLEGTRGADAHRAFAGGEAHLRALVTDAGAPPGPPSTGPLDDDARVLAIAGARAILGRVRAGRRKVLAGIGGSFLAARVAQQLHQGLTIVVETGLHEIDGARGGSFLLGWDYLAGARRLTSIEDALGAVACGAAEDCVAVVGAAQVDGQGRLNSTRLAGGRILTGSGGAADLAAAAGETVVVVAARPGRLVAEVDYVTANGARVTTVATDAGTLFRRDGRWICREVFRADDVARLRAVCPWPFEVAADLRVAAVTAAEERALDALTGAAAAGRATG